MCTNYRPTAREAFHQAFEPLDDHDLPAKWPSEVYRDFKAPIIVPNERGGRRAVMANYSFVPERHLAPHVKMDTMNARGEEIGQKKTYKTAWAACQLCLIPTQCVYEPFFEGAGCTRYGIGMADGSDFCVAGLWRQWTEPDGTISNAFTQITLNADNHDFMRKFHWPTDEKRGVVILPREDYEPWLACKDPELARTFLRLLPGEMLRTWPEPKVKPIDERQGTLF